MMAAIKAGERGLKTIVLEKKARPGIKLSITGKGRYNFTNSASVKEFISLLHNGEFYIAVLMRFQTLMHFFL
jgi:predicted flavoprotein YhiN